MNYFLSNEELYHHGILGQKWGIRRFQNKDGTRTAAGKKREAADSGSSKSFDKEKAKKIAVGVGTAAAVAASVTILATNPKARELAMRGAKATFSGLEKAGEKAIVGAEKGVYNAGVAVSKGSSAIGKGIKKGGKALAEGTVSGLKKGSEAATTAALATVGTYGITKVSKKYAAPENATDEQKLRSDLIVNTTSAAIKAATSPASSNSNNGNNKGNNANQNKGAQIGAEISSKIGPPSNKNIDRSSEEYQSLFKDKNGNNYDKDTRSTIKALANAGYDIAQINYYLNEMRHCDYYDLIEGLVYLGIM